MVFYWVNEWCSDDSIIIIGEKTRLKGKMQLHNVIIAIRTDIGFSWLSVYVGKIPYKSTKTTEVYCKYEASWTFSTIILVAI